MYQNPQGRGGPPPQYGMAPQYQNPNNGVSIKA